MNWSLRYSGYCAANALLEGYNASASSSRDNRLPTSYRAVFCCSKHNGQNIVAQLHGSSPLSSATSYSFF